MLKKKDIIEMKILVIFASHRIGGKNKEIENAMKEYDNYFEFDFVHMANDKVESYQVKNNQNLCYKGKAAAS